MLHSLRNRIIVFFAALLVLVQVVAFAFVAAANSTNARNKIDSELDVGERIFARLLEQNRERLSQTARVMAADYGLREAIASDDVATAISALRNHGSRINANMTMLVSLDHRVVADTFAADTQSRAFQFPALIDLAARKGGASSIELIDGNAYQLVVVPVLAPVPIAWIVLGFVVDDALANELRQLTALEVSFLDGAPGQHWRVLASTLDDSESSLLASLPPLPDAQNVHRVGKGEKEQQLRMFQLEHKGNKTLVAVLQRSVAQAIASFDNLGRTLITLGVMSLLLSIAGSVAIAMGVTRPISELSNAAQRIQEGDYIDTVAVVRNDEIGVLATGLNHMRKDIAAREQEILRLAYQDSLTELPNRAMFNARLQEALAQSDRTGRPVTVLVMDLDRFKYINDTVGHNVGDHVLCEVAQRLRALLSNTNVVARLGGDEFAILLDNAEQRDGSRIASQIHKSLEQPILYDGQPMDVGTSIGLAQYLQHGTSGGTLLRNADIAMYVAKRNKTGTAIYEAGYDTHQQQHLSLLSDIRRAVEADELRVFYQPKISLDSSAACAVEALLRWEHPTRGFIPQSEFIPFAEHTGYIKALTRWVLEESIRQCAAWLAQGLALRVSVNISTRDLMTRELPDIVSHLLERYAIPADLICLEITESGFMEDPAHAQRILEQLHDIGVHLSIDDYGTGYSSLSYIARLPVDELKIDRSFVSRMTQDDITSMIVRSTIELGHSLGLKVVAEGVEDEASFRFLRELGCDLAQGYFMSRPLAAPALEEWLRSSRWGQSKFEPGSTQRIALIKSQKLKEIKAVAAHSAS